MAGGKRPPPPALNISSPVPNAPNPTHIPISPPADGFGVPQHSPRGMGGSGRSASAGRRYPDSGRAAAGGVAGLGYDEYDHPSPTHAYLETFDSYPPTTPPLPSQAQQPLYPHQSPGPAGFGRPYSPAPSYPYAASPSGSSPGLDANEKDPLDGREFGSNQYDSNRYLAPSSYPSRMAQSPSQGQMGNTNGSSRLAGATGMGMTLEKPYKAPGRGCLPTNPKKRKALFIALPILLILVAAGAGLGVYFGTAKKSTTSTTGAATNGTSPTATSTGATNSTGGNVNVNLGTAGSGGAGSMVTTDTGLTFTYQNDFGGNWAQNPQNPYAAQSWSPSIMESWTWGKDIIRGVNLGGWLVTEPFIVPGLYEKYQNSNPRAQDEYTLSQAIGTANLAKVMEAHYSTFITEQDFADIASKGLNWVRIPIGFWAIETQPGEPYLANVSWQYFLKAISWGRKYGIRILLDFHALPGSQNGWNHSGKGGSVNWMFGVMGIANAQRHLEQVRTLTQFLSQDGIKQVVPALSLVNEVQTTVVGTLNLRAYYYQAYNLIRAITGYGANNGPIIVLHEGFEGIAAYANFMTGADRIAIDQHPYLAFGEQNLANHSTQARIPCTWGGGTNESQTNFGITIGGEWSNAINNCGKWLNGVGTTGSYNTIPGSLGCQFWEDWSKWTPALKAGMMEYTMASMDALQNWFFWTWRIGNSTEMGYPTSPMWHYKLGVEQGWIPKDPRVAGGYCRGIGVGGAQFAGTHPASATGGIATSVAPQNTSAIAVWPPTSIGPAFATNQIALFPTLTKTGAPITLATQAHLASVSVGNGWAVASDTAGAYVSVAGCSYPNGYDATGATALPTALCTGTAKRDGAMVPRVTAMPS